MWGNFARGGHLKKNKVEVTIRVKNNDGSDLRPRSENSMGRKSKAPEDRDPWASIFYGPLTPQNVTGHYQRP